MKIAIFGGSGQVATELARRVPPGVSILMISRDRADFSKPDDVYKAARNTDADAIINAAAYTAVDQAESEPEVATTINGTSVGRLAVAAAETDTPLVHISTDYVFAGDGDTPWSPDDPSEPQGAYGRSKLVGEEAIRAAGHDRHTILRTSWVFSAHGKNFVKTMLKFGAERPELTVVNDELGGPTPAADIADACYTMAQAMAGGQSGGTYHFSGAPDVSWCDFAKEIMTMAQLPAKVTPILSKDWKSAAKRPLNSRMDCTSLEREFGIARPDWKAGLKDVLDELSA